MKKKWNRFEKEKILKQVQKNIKKGNAGYKKIYSLIKQPTKKAGDSNRTRRWSKKTT